MLSIVQCVQRIGSEHIHSIRQTFMLTAFVSFHTGSLEQRSPTPGHLIPGRTERINNLHYSRFIYYLSPEDVLF